jgi:hypothetical protein
MSSVRRPLRIRSALTALARMPPEVAPGIDRLLGGVEQQDAAGALAEQDRRGRLGDPLMGEEIELEAVPQHLVGNLADGALPGGAGVGNQDVQSAEGLDRLCEGGGHGAIIGDVAGQGQGAHLAAALLKGRVRQVQDRHLRALGLEGCCRGPADGAGPAGHRHHVAGERGLLALAQLGLLQGPVLDVEELRVAEAGEVADGFRLGDHLDGGLRQVRHNPGVLGALAGGEEPDARHQEHPRHGIERLLGAVAWCPPGGRCCG